MRALETGSERIRCELDGRLGVVTLDRPERHNALDVEMTRALRSAALRLARDPEVGAILLRGAGGSFCSGVDLGYVRGGGEAEDLDYLVSREDGARTASQRYGASFKAMLEYLASTISEIRRAPKPVIAGVDGVAAAGGLGLALCCDLVVASRRSCFEWAYQKTGLSGAEAITFFLPRLVGLRRALDLALLAPRIDAERALRMALVSEVYDDESFEHELFALGRRLADGPTEAYGRTKALLEAALAGDWLEEHLGREIEQLVASAESARFAAGLEDFFGGDRRRGTGS